MLDRKLIVEQAELVRANCANRGVTVDLDRFLQLELTRKELQRQLDEANRKANEVSKSIGAAKDPAEREARKQEGRHLREQAQSLEQQSSAILAELDGLQRGIPNLTHPDAPVGPGDSHNKEVAQGRNARRELGFAPQDHVALAEKWDLLDLEGGARVAGHGFYFLKNEAVLLELALQRYVLDLLLKEGFTPTVTPDLARNEILEGIGFIPRGPERQIYNIEETDLSLVATAEITLGGMYSGQILEEAKLPLKICGISHCFRTEAGAHGRATRGIYRVHQFTKVEMFVFCVPAQSNDMLEYIRGLECQIFDGLDIPYRVIDTATGDLGGPAYRKYDLEAWMPGRNEWGEVTSTSNCTDYQARRLDIKYRSTADKKTAYLHTLNGTAVAISRALVAILENYQQADGTIEVPRALRTWVGKDTIGPR